MNTKTTSKTPLPATLEIREFPYKSKDYDRALALRDRILRAPLNLVFTEEFLLLDRDSIHIGAFLGAEILGCLSLLPAGKSTIKMRQVAVSEQAQGLGVGRKLVEASEIAARKLGVNVITLSARDTAIPFYLRLGYECVGEPFIEVSIEHRTMQKRI
jgi:GNAT superfamily N-acetyltransferase